MGRTAKTPAKAAARSVKSMVKHQRILDAAAHVFSRKGYSEATLTEIAKMAGTHAGSLYYHFESRDHLVVELLNYAVIRMEQDTATALSALPPGSNALDRLVTLIRSHVMSALKLDDYARATQKVSDQVSDEIRGKISLVPRRYAKRWDVAIKEAVAEGYLRPGINQRLLRLMIVGAVSWIPDWFKPGGPSTPEEIAEFVVDIFMRGAGVPAQPAAAKSRSSTRGKTGRRAAGDLAA